MIQGFKQIREKLEMEKESIKNYREWHRLNAIALVNAWTETSLKDFQEPIRKGLKRGAPIGFGLAKMKAVHYAAAYPMALKTREIAAFCGISEGEVGVYRTETTFCSKAAEIHRSLGELIAEDLKIIFESADKGGRDFNEKSLRFRFPSLKGAGSYYDYYVGLLPWLAETVTDWVLAPIAKRVKRGNAGLWENSFIVDYQKAARVRNLRELHQWEKDHREQTKAEIGRFIDLLAEGKGDAEFREHLKHYIFDKMDILAY